MKSLTPATIVGFSLLLSSAMAFAGATPLEFSDSEKAMNLENAKLISESAAACINRTWETHNTFFKKRGYSKYYGNRKPEHKTRAGRKEVLLKILPTLRRGVLRQDKKSLAELEQRLNELEATSCIGLTVKCLGEGFKAAGMNETWSKIYDWVGRTGEDGSLLFYGTDLQKALVDLGWKSIFWNPDLEQNEEWDSLEHALNPAKEGKAWNPVWGGHAYRWTQVKRNRDYYGVPIQDIQTLVNFGVSPPADFKAIPFFVGTAHAGYHVFPGFNGRVIEAHSMRELKSHANLEVGPFNPLNQELNGVDGGTGAPKWTNLEQYRSGVIVVPPGMLADKPFTTPGPSTNTPPNGSPRPKNVGRGDSRDNFDDYDDDYYDDEPKPRPRPQQRERRRDRFFPGWFR